jgi:hypothetical protein
MGKYSLDDNGQFLIENYQKMQPFASFLPGIAGVMGVPLWVFYVNRGQAIASFGVENKDKPILEFQPANRAYQLTSFLGFRTFIRMADGTQNILYEPFLPNSSSQKMIIGTNELCLQENDRDIGLKTEVVYFLLPGENMGGLVRLLTITNLSERTLQLEILDGLPAIIPYGVTNQILKDISRTAEAWMDVYNLERNIPYYRLRASIVDTVEVSSFDAGHFMLSSQSAPKVAGLLPVIIDPSLIFGQNTALNSPDAFCQRGLKDLLSRKQITCGRTPCGFAASQVELAPGESVRLNTILGHVSRIEDIQPHIKNLINPSYLDGKRTEAYDLVHNLTDAISCRTGSLTFDAYCRQTFLDNVLRGGRPMVFGAGKNAKIYHIYSRKHGDLERDYNSFSFAPEYYSQGNGSYRDVNQNRREDVWFYPKVGDFNIRVFMSLIQADGYNPLVVQGSLFTVKEGYLDGLLTLANSPEKLRELLSHPFSPGSVIKSIVDGSTHLTVGTQAFLEKVLEKSEQHIQAATGEGYWVDHWTYNLDLIESFLGVFPERLHELLFSNCDLPFYDNALVVQPRSKKYVLVDGQPRQLGSLIEDRQKAVMISARQIDSSWLRIDHGKGKIYRTTLFAKLFCLALIKFATMDPGGMGIEMEAGRPGWDDAMNGLPGLFGSSMAETFALERMVRFLRSSLRTETTVRLKMPIEMMRMLRRVVKEIGKYRAAVANDRDYRYWDNVSAAREVYRKSVRMGLDGAEEDVTSEELEPIIGMFEEKINIGIDRALSLNNGLPPTYFIYLVDEFELLTDRQGRQKLDVQGRPLIRVGKFAPQLLPLFLEGMVRAMRILDVDAARRLYGDVKASSLYDANLKMYKLNASLDRLPKDIGRARAFTPGWLENESIWLHMEYKYLLEILRAGLYDDFFKEIKATLIPFLDPQKYGRSPLENSSFLVSSVHPDELLHGAGFVARLSGASAEFLSMWRFMMAGIRPFFMEDDHLCLLLKPILPGWFFDENNAVSFKLFGQTTIIYHNTERRNTYDPQSFTRSIKLLTIDGTNIELTGAVIPAPYAQHVREGLIVQIDVDLV